MRLNLKDIIEVPGKSVPFECVIEPELISFDSIAEFKSAPKASGRVSNKAGVLVLEGVMDADTLCICDRCGEEFDKTMHLDLEAVIGEKADEDDPDIFPIYGDEADLDEIISTLFILGMDSKVLCREDCKGLCPTCGKNLNHGPCECRKEKDPRFAVLEQLLDKE